MNEENDKTLFGFWVYLMTDLIMFAGLFAAYAVLRANSFGGPTEQDIFNLPYVLIETLLLLTSSLTCGIAVWFAQSKKVREYLLFIFLTFLLGISFLGMELFEFNKLISDGASFQRSAFLSSYFSLVGTHGLHITVGLLWMVILVIHTIKNGLHESNIRKLTLLGLFWHFLDIVWIFIFTFVYLIGVL